MDIKNRRTHALVPLILLLAAACGDARGAETAPPASAAVPVRTAPVTEETSAQPIIGTGVLAAQDEVDLSFKIGGVIVQLAVHEGERVRRGQTLAVLDLREIDAQVSRARSSALKAERDLQRARNLYADSVATLEQLQNATTGVELARSELQAASVNRRYAAIVAPADGTVLRRLREPGEVVSPGAVVLRVGSGRGSVLRVGLADRDVVRLRHGDAAVVQLDAYPGQSFAGRVTEIAAAADPQTGTYGVEITLADGDRALPSGMVGRAEIRPSQGGRVQMIPVEAILEADDDRGAVYTLSADGRRARRLPVSIAALRGDRVAIAGGLEGVERVVTDGAAYLDEGVAVEVVP